MTAKEAIVLVGADLVLYEEVKNILRNVGIQVEKVARLVTGGAPSIVGMGQWRYFFCHQRLEG